MRYRTVQQFPSEVPVSQSPHPTQAVREPHRVFLHNLFNFRSLITSSEEGSLFTTVPIIVVILFVLQLMWLVPLNANAVLIIFYTN